jgi:predicted nuclease of predicted toxin-antitoxin system
VKVVADEGVDRPIVARLRQDGHEVDYVAEMDPGIDDDRVLSHANQQHALLMTADKDFGELVFMQGRLNAGVVLLRLAGVPPTQKANIVSDALAAHGSEMQGAFSVITDKMLRIRPYRTNI